MVSTALTLEPSTAPASSLALASKGSGSPAAPRNKPSSLRWMGLSASGVTIFSRPRLVEAWPGTLALMVPSVPRVISEPGGTSIGAPPSDSTGRPVGVTKALVLEISKIPLRV